MKKALKTIYALDVILNTCLIICDCCFLALSGIIRGKVTFEIQKYECLLSKYLKKVKILILIMSL